MAEVGGESTGITLQLENFRLLQKYIYKNPSPGGVGSAGAPRRTGPRTGRGCGSPAKRAGCPTGDTGLGWGCHTGRVAGLRMGSGTPGDAACPAALPGTAEGTCDSVARKGGKSWDVSPVWGTQARPGAAQDTRGQTRSPQLRPPVMGSTLCEWELRACSCQTD